MKRILIFALLLVCAYFVYCKVITKVVYVDVNKVEQAQAFCKQRGYNVDYCFFVDFSQSTQAKRFYVYDFRNNKVVYTCYCAHGNDGSKDNGSNGKCQTTINSFSNKVGSHKSSLGKYRIGKRRTINSVDGMFDVSMFNIPCYEMHGLESSNSNAYKRGILLHPMPTMDSNWLMTPPGTSLGCFSVGINAFDKLSKYIDNSDKPILLWAYYNK